MKNKSINRILVLSIILFAFVAMGFSVAKYVTTSNNDVSTQKARWSVSTNTPSLTNTAYNANTITASRIAPGTEGYFDVNIDATNSEVGVNYIVNLTNLQNKPANLYFYIGDDESTKYIDLSDLGAALSGTINANATTKTVSKRVHWKWPYTTTTSVDGTRTTLDANNVQDTIDGTNTDTMSFNINIIMSQVQPQ